MSAPPGDGPDDRISELPGTWSLTMRTPVGTIRARMTFVDDHGTLVGTAEGKGESVALRQVSTARTGDGEHVTWSQSITKPIRLDLDFEVVVVGDTMEGHSRAGRLPRSAVSGRRTARP